jgi:hypothetical protein
MVASSWEVALAVNVRKLTGGRLIDKLLPFACREVQCRAREGGHMLPSTQYIHDN